MKEFDEFEAVEFIKNAVPELHDCNDDDILLIIDTMLDYDEMVGEDATDEQLSVEAVAAYVAKQVVRDPEFSISAELIAPVVQACDAYDDYLMEEE